MTRSKARSSQQKFSSRVRITVSDKQTFAEQYAENLSANGMFVKSERPPSIGETVLVVFLLPDGSDLSRVSARVVYARPAMLEGDRTAGMGLEFIQFDNEAQSTIDAYKACKKKTQRAQIEKKERIDRIFKHENLAPDRTDLEKQLKGPFIGIDLGTTNSCAAFIEKREPKVITTMQGFETVPSVVFVTDDKKMVAGHKAIERMILDPDRAIYGSKRFIGRPFASREVKTFGHFFNYELTSGRTGLSAAKIHGTVFPLEVVAAYVLLQIKRLAQQNLGCNIKNCIITVPAYFGEIQRKSVYDAGRAAGLNVMRVISEPTAAAVAFGYGRGLKKTVLVYDLGGGTFDASILRINHDQMEALATDGDPFLGGSDFDDRLTEYVLMILERNHQIHLRNDPVVIQRLRFAVELAKKQLSDSDHVSLDIPYLCKTDQGNFDLCMPIDRTLFERLTEDLVVRSLTIVRRVLDEAKFKTTDIDEVILVGGQSRSPHIRRLLGELFGHKKMSRGVHPDHAVALGAAIVAESIYGNMPIRLTDILPSSIRLALPCGQSKVLLPRGCALPAQALFELESTHESKQDVEFVARLCRGESENTAQNEDLGEIHLSSNLALLIAKTKARARLIVTEDGVMKATLQHPLTGIAEELEVYLQSPNEIEEDILEVDDIDIIPLTE